MKRKSASFIVTSLVLVTVIFMLLFSTGTASYATKTETGEQDEVRELKKQVVALEQRVGALEKQLAEIRKPKMIPAKGQPR